MKSTALATRSGAIHQCQTKAASMPVSLDGSTRVPHSGLVRRLFVIVIAILVLTLSACGGDDDERTGGELPSPVPAPTPAGRTVELDDADSVARAEAVIVSVPLGEELDLHALPGGDRPIAGTLAPDDGVDVLGEAFETPDGVVWWRIGRGSVQGWTPRTNIAFLGAPSVATDDVLDGLDGLDQLDDTGTADGFDSPEESARLVAETLQAERDAADIVVVWRTNIERPASATVAVDLLGLDDEATAGYRLLVAAAESTGWAPVSVTELPLCVRGVGPSGSCS